MGPKRRAERSSTRERVIQAADRLWGANGVRGASLDDIAREASVTKPTVYYYFADKSALFTAVICSVLEEHGAGLKTAAHRGSRARERLVSALAFLVSARCSGPRLLREGGVALCLVPLGVDQPTAVTLAFLWFAVFALVGLLGGLVYLCGAYPKPGTVSQASSEATDGHEPLGCHPDQGREGQLDQAA